MTYAIGSTFLALGFLVAMLGIGLMYFSAEDEDRNQGRWWINEDPERTEDNQQRFEAGRLLMWGGLIVFVVGGVLLATGGSRRAGN